MNKEQIFLLVIIITCALLVIFSHLNKDCDSERQSKSDEQENFYGGFYYPYDYPYYYPYFYSGCNENVFGKIKCVPPYMGYW
jgi:hypothetical protein